MNFDLLRSNADKLGLFEYLVIGCEECSELLCELSNSSPDNKKSLIEECADVYICITSIDYLEGNSTVISSYTDSNYLDICSSYIKYSMKKLRLLREDATLRMGEYEIESEFFSYKSMLLCLINDIVNNNEAIDEFKKCVNYKLSRSGSMLGGLTVS